MEVNENPIIAYPTQSQVKETFVRIATEMTSEKIAIAVKMSEIALKQAFLKDSSIKKKDIPKFNEDPIFQQKAVKKVFNQYVKKADEETLLKLDYVTPFIVYLHLTYKEKRENYLKCNSTKNLFSNLFSPLSKDEKVLEKYKLKIFEKLRTFPLEDLVIKIFDHLIPKDAKVVKITGLKEVAKKLSENFPNGIY